jgi:hypothetical protein
MDNLDQNSSSSNFFQYISKNQLKKTNFYSTREDFLLEKFPNWHVMSIALNGAGNMDLFLQKESASTN